MQQLIAPDIQLTQITLPGSPDQNHDTDATLLLIDDEENLLFGIKTILHKRGFEVLAAMSGEEGLRLARENHPDVIVCDVGMPPPNGFTIKRLLSENDQTAEIPFIFLTAHTTEVEKVEGLRIGADDYITKPFNIDELVARIQAVLRRASLSRQRGMREAEEMLEKTHQDMASNFSHELRTPLGIILSTLDLAIQDKQAGSTAELGWYLNTALNSARRLQFLVNDIIILNAIDRGNLARLRQEVDLDFDVLEPIQKTIEYWEDKGLKTEIRVEPGTRICAALPEFSLAVEHLVDNAAKFSPKEGKIGIELRQNGQGGCILEVQDEGAGIPPDQRERVFERYYQISQGPTREFGGLGLGLTIAQAVAESLGGSVELLDAAWGCRVRMSIPPGEDEWSSKKAAARLNRA